MPLALGNNGPQTMLDNRPRQISLDEAKRRREVAICPTDDDTITPQRKKRDKQSFDYVWRSGLAGGLAGSAVCFL
jgi:solute carrier family 25 protein 16